MTENWIPLRTQRAASAFEMGPLERYVIGIHSPISRTRQLAWPEKCKVTAPTLTHSILKDGR
jgi:hypothetical protein